MSAAVMRVVRAMGRSYGNLSRFRFQLLLRSMKDRKDLKDFVIVATVAFCGLLVPAVPASGGQQTEAATGEAAAAPTVDAPLPRLKLPDNLFIVKAPVQGGVPKPGQTVKPPMASKEFEKASF